MQHRSERPFQHRSPAIDYATPRAADRLRESPLLASLLCIPGIIAWGPVFLLIMFRWLRLPHGSVNPAGLAVGAMLLVWMIALGSAIASLTLYLPRGRRPWYVWLNLAVNVPGLVFAAWMVPVIFGRMAMG